MFLLNVPPLQVICGHYRIMVNIINLPWTLELLMLVCSALQRGRKGLGVIHANTNFCIVFKIWFLNISLFCCKL